MRYIANGIISIYIVITLLILGYDVLIAFVERYSHFHMGRWTDYLKWKNVITKVCCKWTVKTPVLRIKKDCRYLLLDKLHGTYGKRMVQSWQTAGCILGLKEEGAVSCQKAIKKVKKKLINDEGDWKQKINRVDYGMLSYALLKNEEEADAIKRAMDSMIRCIEENLCEDGMISYSAGKNSERRYVDTLGFVCPFLALYGRVYGEKKYIILAVNQIQKFHEIGIKDGLVAHCIIRENGLPLGIYGWGRGTGWYTLGLIDLYLELKDKELKNSLKPICVEIAEACLKFERVDGGFSSILHSYNVYDSSATAMLGYFYAQCGRLFGNDMYTQVAKRCVKRLMKVTKISGVIDECQGDTIDIGIFSERYAEMPFVQGMVVRLVAVLEQN